MYQIYVIKIYLVEVCHISIYRQEWRIEDIRRLFVVRCDNGGTGFGLIHSSQRFQYLFTTEPILSWDKVPAENTEKSDGTKDNAGLRMS